MTPIETRAGVFQGGDDPEIVLDNGLVRRVFRLSPGLASTALDSHMTGATLLRAVEPEAVLVLDGKPRRVGGLLGQPERAYLRREFLASMTADPDAFRCESFAVGETRARLEWKRVRHAEERPWPPPGVSLTFRCISPDPALSGVRVEVHYELYDGLPLFAKWLTVANETGHEIVVDSFVSERLAFVEAESFVEKPGSAQWRRPPLEVFSDYSFGGGDLGSANRTTEYRTDPAYTSQVNYRLEMPAILVSRPPLGSFIEATGLELLEHDGPYPGDVCASTTHPGHRGERDSQWAQWRLSADLYAWARARGTSLNVPDYYFLVGSNKVAMGYREVNWSLPRERQILLGRQNVYDGTWTKTPTMGWMFVPLTEYHGGGAAATLEPLVEHLPAYEAHLINNLAAGVLALDREYAVTVPVELPAGGFTWLVIEEAP